MTLTGTFVCFPLSPSPPAVMNCAPFATDYRLFVSSSSSPAPTITSSSTVSATGQHYLDNATKSSPFTTDYLQPQQHSPLNRVDLGYQHHQLYLDTLATPEPVPNSSSPSHHFSTATTSTFYPSQFHPHHYPSHHHHHLNHYHSIGSVPPAGVSQSTDHVPSYQPQSHSILQPVTFPGPSPPTATPFYPPPPTHSHQLQFQTFSHNHQLISN